MDMDFLLVQKMRMGDEKAVEAFVTKYYTRILKYCRMRVNDYGYAEDATQETFERFFRNLEQYHHFGRAANYLYVIAGNLCRNVYRKNREIPMEELPGESLHGNNFPGNNFSGNNFPGRNFAGKSFPGAVNLQEQMEVKMALESLPEDIRETAVLFFVHERKQKEIAEILGIGVPLVKYRVRRARELLKEYFSET